METRFLRSESPPEGWAKYWNNIPPTPVLVLVLKKLPQDQTGPDRDMARCNQIYIKHIEREKKREQLVSRSKKSTGLCLTREGHTTFI